MAVDAAGNVYVADTYDDAINEWNASTQAVTTLVSSALAGPTGVAVDAAGNVYVVNQGDGTLKEWQAATQTVTTLIASGLNQPYSLAVDASGNVYVADSGDGRIVKWNASTASSSVLVLRTGLPNGRGGRLRRKRLHRQPARRHASRVECRLEHA